MSNRVYSSDQPVWQHRLAKTLLLMIIVSIILFIFILTTDAWIKDIGICAGIIWNFVIIIVRSKS